MKDKEPDFEQALDELEKTVESLETGGLSLNESLALFEKGVKLARFLRTELDKAEKKVEILLKDEKGELRPVPFDVDEDEDAAGNGDAGEAEGEKGEAENAGGPRKKARAPRPAGRKKPEGGDDSLPF